jgi:hypothetical protein
LRWQTIALFTSVLLIVSPALAATSEIRLENGNNSEATLRFSCEEEGHRISVDLENPPPAFVEEEDVIGIFDGGTSNAFSLHGFTVSMDKTHTRLMLDPDYRGAADDALGVLQGPREHSLTIIAPKSSLQIRWPLTAETVAAIAKNYKDACR